MVLIYTKQGHIPLYTLQRPPAGAPPHMLAYNAILGCNKYNDGLLFCYLFSSTSFNSGDEGGGVTYKKFPIVFSTRILQYPNRSDLLFRYVRKVVCTRYWSVG